jgi:hypothetical protein
MTDELRSTLLALHKTLVNQVKSSYEAIHGPVAGPAALFRLLVDEPAFQWLRPLSETIVGIDEALEKSEPASPEAVVEMVRGRLFPSTPTEFSQKLTEASQKNPSVKAIHDRVTNLMNR